MTALVESPLVCQIDKQLGKAPEEWHLTAGAQGTALLQPLPSPYGAAEVQGKAYVEEPESLQNSGSLQNSSTITVADMPQLTAAAPSPKKSVELLPEMEDAGVGCICS